VSSGFDTGRSNKYRRQCFCNEQFNVKDCSVDGIYKSEDVLKHDPESLACEGVNVIGEFALYLIGSF
jgi:hypothetical protein